MRKVFLIELIGKRLLGRSQLSLQCERLVVEMQYLPPTRFRVGDSGITFHEPLALMRQPGAYLPYALKQASFLKLGIEANGVKWCT